MTKTPTKTATDIADKDEAQRLEANGMRDVPTPDEKAQAAHDGAIEAIKDAAGDRYMAMTDGALPSDAPPQNRWLGSDEIMQYAGIIDYGVDQFVEAVSNEDPDKGVVIPEEKVAGLLKLERSGKNRTPYVEACMKRLKVDSVYEVTDAGPDYTNDITPTKALKK